MNPIFLVVEDHDGYDEWDNANYCYQETVACFSEESQATMYALAHNTLAHFEDFHVVRMEADQFLNARCVEIYVARLRPNGEIVDHKRRKRVLYGGPRCCEIIHQGKSVWCYSEESQEAARKVAASFIVKEPT